MRTNIVFDMGNVLTRYSMKEYIRKYAASDEASRIIKNEVCASVEWIRMDRGTMTDEEAIASICRRVPEKLHDTVSRFIGEFRMEQEPNPPMEDLVRRLKAAGNRLYLMSNTSRRFRRFSQNIASIAYMDDIWISCERGFLKPEREAYLDFFDVMGLAPETCCFIDDSPANIEAAQRLGMEGCVYHQDVGELERRLRSAGICLSAAEGDGALSVGDEEEMK
ncbi:MAG: HAD family phosphatase [Roseburia sp.]|nr:HAD family phosphatase [Roseburia sp.]